MSRTGYTHIEVLLDRSGSMEDIKSDMEGGFNTFLAEQKDVTGYATIGLTQFDTEHETVYSMLPIKEAPSLRLAPRGGTALIDALCRSIDDLGKRLRSKPESERPEKVIFVIITDGYENSSRRHVRADANQRITRQREDYQWEFIFLGANQDAIAEAHKYGIPMASSMTYDSGAIGVRNFTNSLSANVTATRATGAGINFNDADRAAATKK